MNLEERIEEEKRLFIETERALRSLVKIKGLSAEPTELEVKIHTDACRGYYELYGTTEGERSPFIRKGDKL